MGQKTVKRFRKEVRRLTKDRIAQMAESEQAKALRLEIEETKRLRTLLRRWQAVAVCMGIITLVIVAWSVYVLHGHG